MTRCPNCGSAIRIGAKFCTSCGFRLTVEEPVAATASVPSRSPFATTSTPAWSAEPAEAATRVAIEADEVGADTGDVEVLPDVEPAWSTVQEVTVQEVEETQSAAGDASRSEPVDVAQVDAPGDGAADDLGPGPSWMAPPPQDTTGPVGDDMVAALGDDATDSLHADVAAATGGAAAGTTGDAASVNPIITAPVEATRTTYAWNGSDQQIVAVRDVVPATTDSTDNDNPTMTDNDNPTTTDGAGDPLTEARSLASRLSHVLAAVPAGGAPAPRAAVTSSIQNEGDVDALRSIITAAQERPRDVDVMLDLVLRADTIAALIADRDHLLAALRGDDPTADATNPVEATGAASDDQPSPVDVDEPSTYPAWGS